MSEQTETFDLNKVTPDILMELIGHFSIRDDVRLAINNTLLQRMNAKAAEGKPFDFTEILNEWTQAHDECSIGSRIEVSRIVSGRPVDAVQN